MSSNLKNLYLELKSPYATDGKYLAVITKNGLWIKDEINDKIIITNSSEINNTFLINNFITEFDKSYNVESKDFGTADIRNIIGKYPVEEHLQNIGMKFLENQLSRLNTRVSEKSVIYQRKPVKNFKKTS